MQINWRKKGRALEENLYTFYGEVPFLWEISLTFRIFVDYDIELVGTVSANLEAHSWYWSNTVVELGGTSLSHGHQNGYKYSLTQSSDLGNSLSAEASVSGYVGVAPGVGAEVDVLWMDAFDIELAATLGIEGQTSVRTTPYDPRPGVDTTACKACHYGRGDFTTFARRLVLRSDIAGFKNEFELVRVLAEKEHKNCYWKSDCFYTPLGKLEDLNCHSVCAG